MGLSIADVLEADELIPAFQDFFSRIADRVNSGAILGDLPAWITRHTKLKGRKWSFKDHEFQLAIARDQANKKVVKKCSQVGLTELQIRLALAYLRVSNGRALMYVLPYTKLAQKVSQSRIEEVIQGSDSLRASLSAGANSALYKKIGQSHLYVGGADKATEAISSPIDRIIIDERNFCRDRVLGIYSSRMRHTEEGTEMRDEFSTPTITNYGVSAGYEESDQKLYFCKCAHCEHWQPVDFESQVVIPEYDGRLIDLEKEDFTLHRYDWDKAYICCLHCGKELDSALRDPARRQWIAKYPGRLVSGYWVQPTDVPKYNSTPRILKQIPDYPVQQDFYNFVLGRELDTLDNKINDKIVKECFDGEALAEGDGFCVGIDVGKYVHVFFAKKIDGRRRVVAAFKLNFVHGDVFDDLCDLLDRFGFLVCTIDSGPDISLPKRLIAKYGHERVHACYYIKNNSADSKIYKIDEDTGEMKAQRTKLFDAVVRSVNKQSWQFPRMPEPEKKEICEHFQQMARKEEYDTDGEKVARWIKLSENDHYLHALAYTFLSMEILDDDYSVVDEASIIGISGVKLGGSIKVPQQGELGEALGMYGFGRR